MKPMYDSPWSRMTGLRVPAPIPALALVLFAAPIHAQFDSGNGHSFDLYPETGSLGIPSSSAPGHLFGDLGVDVIVMFDETPMVFKAPEVYRSRSDLPVVANDLTVYPRFPAGPDWIFVVGPDGLTRWIWDGAAFVDSSPVDQSGSLWLGAVDIGTADIDGDADMDLYGVNAARDRVLLSRFVAQVWDNTTSTFIPEPILAVEPVEWDGMNHQELAVRTASWLYIVDFFGNVIDSQQMDQVGKLMRVIEIPQAANQALCLFFDGPLGPHQRLDVVSSGLLHQSIDLGSLGTVSIQLGDLDLDLDTDLVLSHTAGATLELWQADLVGGQLSFSQNPNEPNIAVPQWFSSQLNEATPAVADFDNDSDFDVLFAPVGTDRIDLSANNSFDETTLMCTIKDRSMTLENEGGKFLITLNVPLAAQSSNPDPSIVWTDIEVTVWRQPRFDYYLLASPFIATAYHPIVSDEVCVPIQTAHTAWFEDIFHIEARLVERQGGVPIKRGPGYTGMIGLSEPINALWEVEGLSGAGPPCCFFPIPPGFEYPFLGGTATYIRGQETLGGGGRRLPGTGMPSTPPTGTVPDGLPNPLYDGHQVRYDDDEAGGTLGGGSGGLPDLPATPTNFPPISP